MIAPAREAKETMGRYPPLVGMVEQAFEEFDAHFERLRVLALDEELTLSDLEEIELNIIDKQDLERVLVFCNRRDEVSRLADMLTRYGVNCSELSGDIPQKKRTRRLEQFKADPQRFKDIKGPRGKYNLAFYDMRTGQSVLNVPLIFKSKEETPDASCEHH